MILDSVQVLFLKKLPFFFGARFFFLQFLSGAGFPAGAAEIETSDGADFPIANTSQVVSTCKQSRLARGEGKCWATAAAVGGRTYSPAPPSSGLEQHCPFTVSAPPPASHLSTDASPAQSFQATQDFARFARGRENAWTLAVAKSAAGPGHPSAKTFSKFLRPMGRNRAPQGREKI